MDDTPLDPLLTELEESDPAEAPEIADALAERLGELLEAANPDAEAPQA